MGSERRGWARDEAGNTLVLFPAAVLIVLGLGGLAIDAATVFLGQRRLADLAASVANDAVAGIDLAAFYAGDPALRVDPDRAGVRRTQLVAAQPQDRGFEAVTCDVAPIDGPGVVVTCEAEVRPIFAPVVPGAPATRTVRATETAVGRLE